MNDLTDHECWSADEVSAAIERMMAPRLGRQPRGDELATAFETARRTGWLDDCPDHPERYVLRDGEGNAHQAREPMRFTNRKTPA